MKPDFLRRLSRLEALIAQHRRGPVRLAYICGEKITDEQRAALAPGERVVEDWCACSSMLQVRHRITTDPGDMGQCCGNRDELPKEGQPPRSGESDGADDKPACWYDKFRKELPISTWPPQAAVKTTSPA